MILDIVTLRVAFCVVALVLVVLFYFESFRSTRSAYSSWWCVALVSFLAGAAGFLLNGSAHQWWAQPLANALTVYGTACIWAGARSLRTSRPRTWQLAAAPMVTLVVSVLDHPGTNVWAAGPVFLASIALLLGRASHELWELDAGYSRFRIPMAAAAGLMALYYFSRLSAFLIGGPDTAVFRTWFGPAVTTLAVLVWLVVACFSMSALSSEQQTRALRIAATRDGLTGLLNRAGFIELAAAELRRLRQTAASGSVILADLDHFKAINDAHGHAGGDLALTRFAAACTETVRSTDLVGRFGGEEFIILLAGADTDRADAIARDISTRLARTPAPHGWAMPTVSYGIAPVTTGNRDGSRRETPTLDDLIAAADDALYRAKASGRNRTAKAPAANPQQPAQLSR